MSNATLVKLPKGFKMVGIYDTSRCYGGPEEGGWWYDEYQHIRSEVVPEEQPDDSLLSPEETEPRPLNDPDSFCPEGMEDMPLHPGESLEDPGKMVTLREEYPGEHDNTGNKRPQYH